jgi:hypothetical protein
MKNNSLRVALLLVVASAALHSASAGIDRIALGSFVSTADSGPGCYRSMRDSHS